MKYKYVTTTLPYANSIPHIGHALEFMQADAITRYNRHLRGYDVYFNTGLDEHGGKIHEKAKESGSSPQEFCDEQAKKWITFCSRFDIGYSNFYRTSSQAHKAKVQQFWNDLLKNGDLYKSFYTGRYCSGCEAFKSEKDLVDGKCPDHSSVPAEIKEENWFFRITKYKQQILDHLKKSDQFLLPPHKMQELVNQVDAMEDVSVSRSKASVQWGIEVPNDPDQIIYVWFDALLNYIFAINHSQHMFDVFWNNSLQLCGPDNLRFQGCMFQALLAAAGLPFTKHLLVHGTVTDADGRKMSKSIGNVVDPIEQLEKYGIDAVRYYALKMGTFQNFAWSEKDLVLTCNADLGDNFGNLFARTLHLVESTKCEISDGMVCNMFRSKVDVFCSKVVDQYDAHNISEAIRHVNLLLTYGNQYINDEKPWSSADPVKCLNNLLYLLGSATKLLYPVVPKLSTTAFDALMNKKKEILFPKLK